MRTRKLFKYILEKLYRPFVVRYLSKERVYKYQGLVLRIKPGVFHPAFFFSTHVLLSFLKTKRVIGKKILELGAGSALISMVQAERGAIVTATDISHIAVESGKENIVRNNMDVLMIQSDLFYELKGSQYDIIIINPPYFAADPVTEEQHAWYCGKDFQYFRRLFDQLPFHLCTGGRAYMILSEDCAIQTIQAIAGDASVEMKQVYVKRIWREYNYIFQLICPEQINVSIQADIEKTMDS
jgi:release factor glutamine methyltransferase